MSSAPPLDLSALAIIVTPGQDNVAVARRDIARATTLIHADGRSITIAADVPAGHRFAIADIPAGQWLCQYGQPFAKSLGIQAGDAITGSNTQSDLPHVGLNELRLQPVELDPWQGERPTFMGFVRSDGQVGVRNWVLVVPTSMCSSHEASTIAMQAEFSGLWSRERYPNVNGVTAIPHTRGCGCPDYNPALVENPPTGDRFMGAVESSLRMLGNYIAHPNVGAVLLIELGCEKTNLAAMEKFVARDKPVRTLSVQQCGGTQATIRRGLELLPELLEQANLYGRTRCDAEELCLGLKCGGSDAFSGISANPALGVASDLLLGAGGSSIITEITEFFGAEHLFAARARDRAVAGQIFAAMERFHRYIARVGASMADNPSPGNREGGLLNIAIKSLGAIAKSGRAPVEGVLEYGERVCGKRKGLWLLYGPSYDQESTPALVGSGCQVVCFTTGRGTGIGNAIAPVIKISSNPRLTQRMGGDIDLDAGVILDGADLQAVGRDLFGQVLRVASGEPVKAEMNGHREFMIWAEEGVSL